ncbi:hypothetical protein HRI_001730500 [Hibiscus trionum]|nr:hypothetical protein HRI_001730500 [Hibiscus trionum]
MKESELVKEYAEELGKIADNALENRRLMRQENFVEGAFQAHRYKKTPNNKQVNESYPPCPYCKKTNHPQHKCWWRPDVKCNKCGRQGHAEKICRTHQQ